MNLDDTMLSEVSQTQKDKYCRSDLNMESKESQTRVGLAGLPSMLKTLGSVSCACKKKSSKVESTEAESRTVVTRG
jgi:ferredoxin-thioredoxin reductase catalytic subunit